MDKKSYVAVLAVALSLGIAGCDVDVEEKGRLPDVDVDVKSGKLPDLDVRGPDVDVGTKDVQVTVPDVSVRLPRENDPNVNDRD